MRHWPLIVLVLVFGWSAATIGMRRTEEAPADTAVIRIGHWQLETGVREGFDKLGKEFAELPEVKAKYGKVRVVQDAIPGPTYGQWLTSQVMGETCPDLVEMGQLPDPILLSYQSRYFSPMTDIAERANPFNKGTAMEGVAFKDTFLDGMRAGYQEELQAFMRVPLSRFTSRLFYNKTLLRKLTGLDEPPRELRAFLEVCRKIGGQKMATGENYSAIASSQWHTTHWYQNVAEPFTYANLFVGDYSRDGYVGTDETFAAMAAGKMKLSDATWKARFDITRELDEQFNEGYAGVGRDEALFLFAQERAVFMSTGIYEQGSLVAQAEGKFEVGISDFPRPTGTDKEYGSLAMGPVFDPAGAAFPFGVYRKSKHPDLAKDFLLYLASVKGNQELNEMVGWIPSVAGAPIPGALAKFAPVDQGIYACGNLMAGGNTVAAFNELFSRYQTDPAYTYDQFAHDYAAVYASKGKSDWEEQQRDWQRGILNNDKFLAGVRGEALLDARVDGKKESDDGRWLTYRSFVAVRQVMVGMEHREQEQLVEQGPARKVGPYDYLPEAIERIRKNAATPAQSPALNNGGNTR